MVLYKKSIKDFINPYLWISGLIALTIPLIWIIGTSDPSQYINRLFLESVMRTEGGSDILKFLAHLVSYPVLNIKQLIPVSFILISILILSLRKRLKIFLPADLKLLLIIAFVNYLPYLLAVHSRGRYVIPLFPIITVVAGYIITNTGKEKWVKISIYIAALFIFVRFLVGFIGFPILMGKKASRKNAAYQISQRIDLSKKIACDCKSEKTVCLYLDFLKGKAIKTSKHIPDWDYLIDCSGKKRGKEIFSYDLRGRILKVYKRIK